MTCKSCTWVRNPDGLRLVCGITGWAATKRCPSSFSYEPGADESEDAEAK